VETKQIVSSNSNVILTRQIYGQRSGMAAGGKRRALAFFFQGRGTGSTQTNEKKEVLWEKLRVNSGVMRVARGGYGACYE